MANQIRADLKKSGFVANEIKSVWTPQQSIEWLGFIWNLYNSTLEIPNKKFQGLKLCISALLEGTIRPTCRNLAKVCGKIISMKPALGSICQIMTRHLHMMINTRIYWDSFIHLNDDILQELRFWYFQCEKLHFKCITPMFRLPERIIYSDASEYAGAGFTVGDNHIVHFMWDKEDRIKSSTWRELKAVKNILESLQLMLCGKLIKLYTDNQNVVKIVQKGSMKLDLQVIALDIFHICLNNNIVLEVEWIPRNENTCADALSKIFDFDDWGVSQNIFNFFNSLWGPFTCDTFADDRNKKLAVFFSKFFTPGTSGVDAFAYDWSKFNNWVVPPVNLITRAINHMQMCKAKGVLVVPKWKSAIFWPRIVDRFTDTYQKFVKDFREYKNPKTFFVAGSHDNSIFAKQPFNSHVLSQWKQFEDYANNPRLASVIEVLPSIIESSKAKSTNNKYRIYFEKFRKWCVLFGLQYSPATSTTISLYIGGLIQQGISVSVLEANYYSIKWHHDKNFKDNPCSDEFLSLIVEGGKRILSKPINKKEPVTPEILQMIISKYGIENDLSSLRICVLCLLGFSGFLRYSELAAIKAKHITFFEGLRGGIPQEKSRDVNVCGIFS
ncbi:unnamed protein product [Mytilus edulis]|uniref:RNase H type-1 domain-containing protein n=1 Tax=Mytilus edulis TaxID=6550 RepID=A0A8S3UYJ0_MYTED|nr:unnamed protein product [Mytilus edulis]